MGLLSRIFKKEVKPPKIILKKNEFSRLCIDCVWCQRDKDSIEWEKSGVVRNSSWYHCNCPELYVKPAISLVTGEPEVYRAKKMSFCSSMRILGCGPRA